MVPEARVELARLSTTVFETATSAIPSLGRDQKLYRNLARSANRLGIIFSLPGVRFIQRPVFQLMLVDHSDAGIAE